MVSLQQRSFVYILIRIMESAQGFISTMQIAPSFNSASLYAFAVVIHCRYSVPTKRLRYFIEVKGFPSPLGLPCGGKRKEGNLHGFHPF